MRTWLLLLILLAAPVWAKPADLIIKNAKIYTVDKGRTWAEAAAVSDGRFVCVGRQSDVLEYAGSETEILDLDQRMVLPGLHDSHVHPVAGGVETLQCDLNAASSADEALELITQFAEIHPDDPWLIGGGWALPDFPAGQPNRDMLDQIVRSRPAFLSSADAHTVWVNSKALELGKINDETPDPAGGEIVRDESGRATGLLREEAIKLVADLLPPTTAEQSMQGLEAALKLAASFGITSVIEANATEKILRTYLSAEESGALTFRVLASLNIDTTGGLDQIPNLVRLRDQTQTVLVRANSAKIFTDGVIEGHTAALLEPYLDTGKLGLTMMEFPDLENLVVALDRSGFQLHFHAIGDRGIRYSLDSLQTAQETNGKRDARHHIAHLQLIDPSDLPRFRDLGVVANIQPLWAYRDTYIEKLTEPVLGPERSARLYPFQDLIRNGAVLAAGSDWTVTSMNPMQAIQVGLTRAPLDRPGETWLAEQRLSLEELLAAYTINGAYLAHQEKITGSIEAGKFADFVVLDQNLFEIQPGEIGKTKVLATYLAGKSVFKKD